MSDLWRSKPARDGRDVERVKEASDIARVVGEVVSLRPKGREFVCLCPFHDDHNPSMYVVPSKQMYNCFVCGAAGDVLSFVMRFHKMEFREALQYLAERAGITLTPSGKSSGTDEGLPRAALLSACALASDFFRSLLNHPEHGRSARAVIERRAISPDMTSRFMIGASADRWDGLVLYARSKGLDLAPLLEAGLLKKRDSDAAPYDALRNRLIFPIHDQIGRIIAFGGRRLNDEDEPKYLNSPESRLFNKSATLYGLNHAARAIQAARTAVITEGYTDVIACHQAGFENAVATLGTSLTTGHVGVLRRLCDRVVLLFDGDEAGQRAADRAVETFFSEPLDVAICTLSAHTDAKDPDELLKREGGPEIFARAIAGATDLLEYRFARLRAKVEGLGLSALSKAVDEEIAHLAQMGLKDVPPVRQNLIVKRLSQLAGVEESVILRALPAGRRAGPAAPRDNPDNAAADLAPIQTVPLEARDWILGCVLCDGTLWEALAQDDQADLLEGGYCSSLLQRVVRAVRELADNGVRPSANALSSEDPILHSAAVGLMSRVHRETDHARTLRESFDGGLRQLRQNRSRVNVANIESIVAKVARLASDHKELGADRRVLPRSR